MSLVRMYENFDNIKKMLEIMYQNQPILMAILAYLGIKILSSSVTIQKITIQTNAQNNDMNGNNVRHCLYFVNLN